MFNHLVYLEIGFIQNDKMFILKQHNISFNEVNINSILNGLLYKTKLQWHNSKVLLVLDCGVSSIFIRSSRKDREIWIFLYCFGLLKTG